MRRLYFRLRSVISIRVVREDYFADAVSTWGIVGTAIILDLVEIVALEIINLRLNHWWRLFSTIFHDV